MMMIKIIIDLDIIRNAMGKKIRWKKLEETNADFVYHLFILRNRFDLMSSLVSVYLYY